mmetsp:Transcript_1030/g.1292  ORF Transcript_1030/g.1292 Transcript_1030/m.1292 type:complete len:581 (-) Transcript_1030:160-1902(-)|eukprot:CAMPEP_0194146672 /NCGR_PEP_ID=MMETSP0152-20130528/21264_1 /TAXON_ID=1049557 /ORGANISM="Thalassiothrix antarctica, Strain L6-D1" /LENGTH=580 /DNA_ID=CAMNT_0038847241 /DNA_START=160 /DNA_END=1902 /DNA_ORIENTATION=+
MAKYGLIALTIGLVGAFSPIGLELRRIPLEVSAGRGFIKEPEVAENKPNLGPNPKFDFKNWLKDKKQPVDYRNGTSGNLLVSGNRLIDQFMDQKGGNGATFADPEVLYMLMEEQYHFDFEKIYICAYDVEDAKKRFLSRKARYTGLLDKLEFIKSDFEWDKDHPETFSIPTAEQLKKHGITNWLYLQDKDHVYLTEKIFNVAKECRSQLNNVVMTMMDYYEDEDVTIPLLNKTWNTLGGHRHNRFFQEDLTNEERYLPDDVQYTFLVCATPTNEPEGSPMWIHDDLLLSNQKEREISEEGRYQFLDDRVRSSTGYKGATIAKYWDRISQYQMYRFTVDALDLACMSGRAFHFRDVWDPVFKRYQKALKDTIIGMRESAFTSTECLSHIIDNNLDFVYKRESKRYRLTKGYGGKLTKNWWDDPKYKKQILPVEVVQTKSDEELEIEEVAKQVGERKYYNAVISGKIDKDAITRDDYIKKCWNDCLKEGEERYWAIRKTYDFENDWDEKMQRRQQVMNEKAEQAIKDMLQEVSPKVAEKFDLKEPSEFFDAIEEERIRNLQNVTNVVVSEDGVDVNDDNDEA